jgi:hypothetical protein
MDERVHKHALPAALGRSPSGGIWVRADLTDPAASREVSLSRELASDPDPERVRRELELCESEVAWSCQYVTRSVFRNLRALDEGGGQLDAILAVFRGRPSGAYDEALLTSRREGDWHRAAADYLRRADVTRTRSAR